MATFIVTTLSYRSEREERNQLKDGEAENKFCLKYDSDEDKKANKLQQVSSLAQSIKQKRAIQFKEEEESMGKR